MNMSKMVTIKNKLVYDQSIFVYQVEIGKPLIQIGNSGNNYIMALEIEDLVNAIETVTGENFNFSNEPKIPKEILDEHAISLWKDVFFNTNSSDLKQKIETANAAVDEFYKKLG